MSVYVLCSEDRDTDYKVVHSYTRDLETAKTWTVNKAQKWPGALWYFEEIDELPLEKALE